MFTDGESERGKEGRGKEREPGIKRPTMSQETKRHITKMMMFSREEKLGEGMQSSGAGEV